MEHSDTTTLGTLDRFRHFRHFFIIILLPVSKVKKLDITDNNSYKSRLFLVMLPDGFVSATSYGKHFITITAIELKLN